MSIRSTSCAGTTLVSFGYDDADRRTSLTLPNGTGLAYGYDDASQLTSLTWSGATVGDPAYTYDAAGRRATMSGSFARLNLPAALSTAQYNANNQLTKWGNKNLSYDNNGNMLGDGTNSYTWNARDQLSAVTKQGQTLPSFSYDAFGRRLAKTLGATTTTYRYDGANTVQELTGGSLSASLLTGLGVDELFQRTEGATTRTVLSDALGSTLALSDNSGVVKTSYTYAPYGETTASGDTSNNTSQFTGRDNDADGLYYYRARYYHPVFGRFISEDPIGLAGGNSNLYAYAGTGPTNFTDPSGLIVPVLGACVASAAFSVVFEMALNSLSGRKNTFSGALQSAAGGCVSGLIGLGIGKAAFGLVGRGAAVTRVFRAGTGAVGKPQITLGQAAAPADRAGIDMRAIELAYEAGKDYGYMSINGAGRVLRGSTGRFLVTLQDAGLASERDAVMTIAHELNHIRGVLAHGLPTEEEVAKGAQQLAGLFFR